MFHVLLCVVFVSARETTRCSWTNQREFKFRETVEILFTLQIQKKYDNMLEPDADRTPNINLPG